MEGVNNFRFVLPIFFINFALQFRNGYMSYPLPMPTNVMNNIFSHIEYLLLDHDCVIVPGFGAFIANMCPASIDYDNLTITPPSRSVMFNQAICSDDGLLANSYVRKHGISFEEARLAIIRETNRLKEELLSLRNVAAGNLGCLRLGEEGNLMFFPAAHKTTSYFKSGFNTLRLKAESSSAAPLEPVAPLTDEQFSMHQDSIIPKETISNETKSYYHLRISKTFTKVAAALMIVAAFALTVILNPIPSDDREQRASVVPVEAIIIKSNDSASADAGNSSAKAAVAEMPEDPAPVPDHYLIIATFSSYSEAMKYIGCNSSENYPLQAVESKRVTRVAIASSHSKEELRKKLNSKEIHDKYPNAWIWSRS